MADNTLFYVDGLPNDWVSVATHARLVEAALLNPELPADPVAPIDPEKLFKKAVLVVE